MNTLSNRPPPLELGAMATAGARRPAQDFTARFEALTGYPPFPWQQELFQRFVSVDVNELPKRCDIPTGLGKTSVLPIWLLALAHHADHGSASTFPRRLVYVVNRRTVVDQATREAERLREKINDPLLRTFWASIQSLRIQDTRGLDHLGSPLAISTLRGQFADNAEWRADPARPAIIVGTVDMIGSRLLFSGYGRGFKTRPLHAGFLGQHSLLVHDEAHLEPAFQDLLVAIEREQRGAEGTRRDNFGRLRVMALTATSRGDDSSLPKSTFYLTTADREHPEVRKRIHAKKGLALHHVEEKKVIERLVQLTLEYGDSGQTILVFVRKVEDVQKIVKKLPRGSYLTLTGTIRGFERDQLKHRPIFARFDPKSDVDPASIKQGTVYLVCTSAGEVGVDLSADHLICDLTPFDSMAQRFGRVNRFGRGDASIDVVHAITDSSVTPPSDVKDDDDGFEIARTRTLALLLSLPLLNGGRRDASPAALSDLAAESRRAAFTPPPEILPITGVLLDAWALTSIVDRLPGRPPVADWLHGVPQTWDPPETYVAWRDEVERDRVPASFKPRELIDVYPLKPHELLRDVTKRVFKELAQIAERAPDAPAWVVNEDGRVSASTLAELTAKGDVSDLAHATVILPPSVGGLDETGALQGAQAATDDRQYDVADQWFDENGKPRRVRLVVGPEEKTKYEGLRLVLAIPRQAEADISDESVTTTVWRWYVQPASADDQGSRNAARMQTLAFHLGSAEHFAREIVEALVLEEPESSAIVWAARFHDLGKERRLWQRSIGNRDLDRTLAKSDGRRTLGKITKYRHELGSLFDVEKEPDFKRLGADARELALHVIAAHHGRARPYFPRDEVFDPSYSNAACAALAREVPRRFARLQRRYGRWGLAYLESLVRAADVLASLAIESDDSPRRQMEATE